MRTQIRLIGLIGAVAILLTACGGAGGNEITGIMTSEEIKAFESKAGGLKLPLDKDGTTITAMVSSSSTSLNQHEVMKELSRRTGLNLDITPVPSATLNDKVKVLVASKTLPDIVMNSFPLAQRNELGMQGAFEAVNKHMNSLPNFKRIFVEQAEELETTLIMRAALAPDENLYFFPYYDTTRDVNYGMLYRKDIFDKHNLTMWSNQEEFYQRMVKLKEIYPNSTPMSSSMSSGTFWRLSKQWGILDLGKLAYDENSGLWESSVISPRYKAMLDFLKKMYDEGLLDPEFITRTPQAWNTLMSQPENSFAGYGWIGRIELLNSFQTVEGYDLRYAYPIGPEGKIEPYERTQIAGPCISAGKNSLLALKLCDYLLSEGGAELMTLGIEGVTYTIGEDGNANYVGFDKNPSFTELEDRYGMFVEGLKLRADRRSCYFNFNEREQEAQDLMLNKEGGGFFKPYPQLSYTSEQKAVIEQDLAALEAANAEFSAQYILTSETGEQAWNNWVERAKSQFNIEETEALANQVQKEFDKKYKK